MFITRLQRSIIANVKLTTRQTSQIRAFAKMAQSSAFTQAVVASMRKLYPEALADKSFDNTGLLLEAPNVPGRPPKSNSVLLTIDLTKAVADEAIDENHSVVVTYHPIIFRALKSLSLGNSQQQSLLRLAANGISVYSPHTSVDAVPGGNADWLCDLVTGREGNSGHQVKIEDSDKGRADDNAAPKALNASIEAGEGVDNRSANAPGAYSDPNYVASTSTEFHFDTIPHSRSVITPSPQASIDSANSLHSNSDNPQPYNTQNTGAGRIITFDEPQPLHFLISRIAAAIGLPKAFPIAIPQWASINSINIKTIGLCAGSGDAVIRAARPQPDLILTGEMSHHEALAIIERGGCIIKLFHSNSERGYLSAVMKPLLETELQKQWVDFKEKASAPNEELKVVISRFDRDPFGIVVLEDD